MRPSVEAGSEAPDRRHDGGHTSIMSCRTRQEGTTRTIDTSKVIFCNGPALNPRVFYEVQARDLVRQTREQKQVTYEQLAKRLVAHGVVLDTQALTNKVNRGRYNFAFALQLLAALDVKMLNLPNVLDPERSRLPKTGFWRPPNTPPAARLRPSENDETGSPQPDSDKPVSAGDA